MELLLLDTDFNSVSIIDTFESSIWTDRYDQYGDFELYLPVSLDFLENIKADYYLWLKGSEHTMIVEQILINTDVENGNHITVSGRSLESILYRRIIWGQKVLAGNLQEAIHTLLKEAIISPTIVDRKISNFVFVYSTDSRITSLTVDTQYTGEDLYTIIQVLCVKNNIGFKITLTENNEFAFSLYSGNDRSYDQLINPYVIFSPNFENIINSSYLESKKLLKNVILVAGEGEGSSRKTAVVGTGTGISRRELYVDARDISSNVGSGVTLTPAQYTAQLTQRGTDSLADNIAIAAFEGEVESTRMYIYGKDFFIGDTVQITDDYGHEGKAKISEFVNSQDKSGISLYPTFKTI